ncbi:hypothetical protein DLAC_11711 [Tieghemostelium lacteum]|uniref:Uncharacterized protein n=1 Tax=Tieghemostelium lacteum TaxID=361077 RepID=A0A151ZBG4_TIELA|nr:hypothetical protein DLAC_11711 [Tieghemostelium lacteum]|eukprot:KYQ91224.1 hypothetical protein DLAC_11711 [Tieghemostelium lacteum]
MIKLISGTSKLINKQGLIKGNGLIFKNPICTNRILNSTNNINSIFSQRNIEGNVLAHNTIFGSNQHVLVKNSINTIMNTQSAIICNIRTFRLTSKSIVLNILSSMETNAIVFISVFVLPFYFNSALVWVPLIYHLVDHGILLFRYKKTYDLVDRELSKYKPFIESQTRVEFQKPSLKECQFDQSKIPFDTLTYGGKQKNTKIITCKFRVPSITNNEGYSTVLVKAIKSPLNYEQTSDKKRFKRSFIISSVTVSDSSHSNTMENPTLKAQQIQHQKQIDNQPEEFKDLSDVKDAKVSNERKYY